MAQPQHTPSLAHLEVALTVLFCLIDDAYAHLNPHGARHYESIKRLSDSEVITLALFQQLRGVESERSFLRDAERFFSHLFPGGSKAPPFLLQPAGFAGAAWVRWGSFSVYGVKLHLICATNRVPLSYELTPANVAEVDLSKELLAEAELGEEVARRLLGDLAYQSRELEGDLAESGIALVTSEASARRPGVRQQIEICFSSLKRVFRLGETLATTLVGLATRIAAKMTAYTYAFLINRMLGRPQGKIKESWA